VFFGVGFSQCICILKVGFSHLIVETFVKLPQQDKIEMIVFENIDSCFHFVLIFNASTMQEQDYNMVKWAIRLSVPGLGLQVFHIHCQ
jgi:hypothetical protein